GEDSFYEAAAVRDGRMRDLVAGLATDADGFAWLSGFLPWLRAEGNMRTAPILLAAEAVHAPPRAGRAGGNRPRGASVRPRGGAPGSGGRCWPTGSPATAGRSPSR